MLEAERNIGIIDSSGLHTVLAGIHELSYDFLHLPGSFRQHLKKDIQAGKAFLQAAQVALPDYNPYWTKSEMLSMRQLKSGYHTSIYKFTSTTGEWVMKVGVAKSPIPAPHPSSPEFAFWYASALDIQREIFQKKLPFLIPEPQSVLYIKTADTSSSTVIIQPFISDIRPLRALGSFPQEVQTSLLEELKIFQAQCALMRKSYGIEMDFLRSGTHFVIGKRDNSPHIVFMDNGPFDKETTPLFYFGSRIAGSLRLRKYQ